MARAGPFVAELRELGEYGRAALEEAEAVLRWVEDSSRGRSTPA